MTLPLHERLAATAAERAALIAAARRLIHAAVTADPPATDLRDATSALEQAVATIEAHVPSPPLPRYLAVPNVERPNDFFPFDPMMGFFSPLAPPVALSWEDGKLIGRARFDTPYEGPPGCVHGGIIAAVFDQILAIPNVMLGTGGPTARLALRYHKPTPLRADLVFEGWQDAAEGKRLHCRGRLLHGEIVTVEAEGTFVRISPERLMKMATGQPSTPRG